MGVGALITAALFIAPVAVGQSGAFYDAAAAKVSAEGAAAADLRAPSAEVARVKAARQARAQAEKKLDAALLALGLRDPGGRERALAAAQVGDERYGSDGSVTLRLTLDTGGLPLAPRPHRRKE